MVKLLIFAILLASPVTGLIEQLFRAESGCHSGCNTNYATRPPHLEACKKGCDFKLHKEDCTAQCKSLQIDAKLADELMQASCQVGCTLSPSIDEAVPEPPVISIDPVPSNPEQDRPRSIILIRLRQRPSFEMPSIQRFFNGDPVQMFNDMIKQFQERTNEIEQSMQKSFEEKSPDFPEFHGFKRISELAQNIPIIRIPGNIRPDSSSESNEETNERRPLINEFRHIVHHPREHEQYLRERVEPINNRFQQFVTNVRSEWQDLVRRQPKIPVWIFIGILLASSVILWYMVMSLCRHTPSRNPLSVRAQELIFHPYEYDAYEKEKIQPDDQPYEVTESLPIKVKLSNI